MSEYENEILELIDNADQYTRSDLQGIVSALVKKISGCTKVPSNPSKDIKARLEYLRSEVRAERISYEELAELQSLVEYIEPGDVELLEAAGVPEQVIRGNSG